MKQIRFISLIGCCFFGALTISCAPSHVSSQLKEVDKSHETLPDWVHKPYREEDGTIYVVGERTGATSQEEGETDARMQAARKLIEVQFGLKGYSHYQRLKNLLETVYQDNLRLKTEGEILGIKEIDIAWKRYESRTQSGVTYQWDVWVRLAVSKAELERAAEQALEKIESAIDQANVYWEESQAMLEKGEVVPALSKLGNARSHLREVGDDPETFALAMDIRSTIQKILSKLRFSRITEEIADCRVGEGLDQPLRIGVNYGGIEVAYLPVVFGFIEGEGIIDELVYTDTAGIASAHVTQLKSPGNPNIVEAKIDFAFLNLEEFPSQKVHFSFGSLPPRGRQPEDWEPLSVPLPSPESGEETSLFVEPGHDYPSQISEDALEMGISLSSVSSPESRFEEYVVMVEVRAFGTSDVERPAMNIAAVLDKSGSMGRENKLEFTKEALYFLLDNLTPRDYLSIIAYDSRARVLSRSASVEDRWFPKHLVGEVSSGQTTNLSSGLLAGYAEIRSTFQDDMVNRVILISDGLANAGITDHDRIYQFVGKELSRGISTTTIGLGSSFDAELMLGIANTGGGKYYFVDNPENIPLIFQEELKSLLAVTAQNISLRVESSPGIEIRRVYGYHDLEDSGDIDISLGDMSSKEHRIFMFKLALAHPRSRSSEEMSLATFRLVYDDVYNSGDRVTVIDTLAFPVDPGTRRKSIKRIPRVDHFYEVAEAFFNLIEYHRSHRKEFYLRTNEFNDKKYEGIRDYALTEEDSCLEIILDSYRDCLKMCKAQLDRSEGGHHRIASQNSLRRETEYFNYLLFNHIDW